MIKLQESYKKRPIRYIELFEHSGWKLKVYGISYNRELPRPALLSAAKNVAMAKLPEIQGSIYGVGYLGVHDGRGVNFVFLDWWEDENELHHHVYISPTDKPELLEEKTHTGVSACVWDLRVMCFERRAWLENVLANEHGPDVNGYLAVHLNEDV